MNWQTQKGTRFKRNYLFIAVRKGNKDWWCRGQWMTHSMAVATNEGYCNYVNCKSIRAFRRHVRKYGEHGQEYELVSRYAEVKSVLMRKRVR